MYDRREKGLAGPYLVSKIEGVVGLHGDGQHILVAIDDRVGDGGQGGVVQLQGHGCNLGDGRSHVGQEIVVVDVQDLWVEQGATLKHLLQ